MIMNGRDFIKSAAMILLLLISSMSIFIEAIDNKNCIRFDITKQSIVINNVVNGKTTKIDSASINIPSKEDVSLTINRRGAELCISINDVMVYRSSNIERGKGSKTAATFNKWKQVNVALYPLDPVFFTDDFMRDYTDINNTNDWEIISGSWHLRSAWDNDPHLLSTSRDRAKKISGGQNPFSWISWGESAIALIGEEDWEDYTFKSAFRATDNSTFGIIINYKDKDNYILATCSSAGDKSPSGNSINLYKIINGNKTLIGSVKGGYLQGEWYELSVQSSINSVTVSLDEQKKYQQKD